MIAAPSPLMAALLRADPRTPDSLRTFDALVARQPHTPDFYEWSARVEECLSPFRLTYYFDVGRRGAEVARSAGERFSALCNATGMPLPAALAALLCSDLPARNEIQQVVLGIDERADRTIRRVKYYLVFCDQPRRSVEAILRAAGFASPSGSLDPSRTYILGLDVGQSGIEDCKLYFLLDPKRTAFHVENAREFDGLFRGARHFVMQCCLRRPERRQLYLHATNERVIEPWLVAASRTRTPVEDLLRRSRAMNQALEGMRLSPWIISFAYRDRKLDPSAINVYFHIDEPWSPSTR